MPKRCGNFTIVMRNIEVCLFPLINVTLSTFNTGFFRPKKDACSRCTRYKNSEKTSQIEEKQKIHLENKDMARDEKQRDKLRAEKDQTFHAVIGDIEQVAPCPKE